MKEVLQRLGQDHMNMARLLDLVDQWSGDIAQGEDHNYPAVRDAVQYFIAFPDRHHHPVEDKLFAWLVERRPGFDELVAALRTEHGEQHEAAADLLTFLEGVCAGHMVPREEIVNRVNAFIAMQREHMDRETVLFRDLQDWALEEQPPAAVAAVLESADPLFGESPAAAFRDLCERIQA